MRLLPLQLPPGMHLYQSIFEPPGRAYISPRAALVPSQEAASVTRPRVALISVARGRPAFIKAEPSLRIQALDAQKLSFVRHFCCPEGSFQETLLQFEAAKRREDLRAKRFIYLEHSLRILYSKAETKL